MENSSAGFYKLQIKNKKLVDIMTVISNIDIIMK